MPTDVGLVAGAITASMNVAYELLHKSTQELIDEKTKNAQHDCQRMVGFLVGSDWSAVQLAFDGLPKYVPVSLSTDEFSQLKNVEACGFDKYDLLGLYCLGRSAKLQEEVRNIVQQKDPQ